MGGGGWKRRLVARGVGEGQVKGKAAAGGKRAGDGEYEGVGVGGI